MVPNLGIDTSTKSIITMQFTVQDEGDVYAYVRDSDNSITYNVWVDDQNVCQSLYKCCAGVIHIGDLHKGQQVTINVAVTSAILSYGVSDVKLYTINNEVVDEYYKK